MKRTLLLIVLLNFSFICLAQDPYYAERDEFEKRMKDINHFYSLRKGTAEQYDSIKSLKKKIVEDYIKDYPSSWVSIQQINLYKTTWGKKWAKKMLVIAHTKDKPNSKLVNGIKKYIELNRDIKLNGFYADFSQENIRGKNKKLSDLRGKYTLLEFWSSTCPPCRKSHEYLVDFYKKYNKKGFEIVGVSADKDKKKWLNAIEKDGLKWENLNDFKGQNNNAILTYGIYSYPTNFLINPEGKIIGKNIRSPETMDIILKALFDNRKELLPIIVTRNKNDTIVNIN